MSYSLLSPFGGFPKLGVPLKGFIRGYIGILQDYIRFRD